jgi:cephalosporin hydroxylase
LRCATAWTPAYRDRGDRRRRPASQSSRTATARKNSPCPMPRTSFFGTDKWDAPIDTPNITSGKFKHHDFTLFEIGIGGYSREKLGGASLRMWKAFFPKAQIIGLDLEDKSFAVEPRIATYQGSQTNEPLLRTIVSTAKNLRVIVDDGSHRPAHIRRTFEILFPLLPAGGLYAIEDTRTSYWPRFGGSLDMNDPSTTMGLAERLVDGLNYEEWQDDDNKATAVDRNIVGVHCYHNLVIIERVRITRARTGDRRNA